MAPDRKQRLKLVVSTTLVTLWGIGALAEWPVLGGMLPLALVFLLDAGTDPRDRAASSPLDWMQPRLIPLFALLFFGAFHLLANHGFPDLGLAHVWRGWLVIPTWILLLAQLILPSDPAPAGETRQAPERVD